MSGPAVSRDARSADTPSADASRTPTAAPAGDASPRRGSPDAPHSRLDTLLADWGKASAGIKRVDCRFMRYRYDTTFGIESRATGSMAADAEGRAEYRLFPAPIGSSEISLKRSRHGERYELRSEEADRWNWTHNEVIQSDPAEGRPPAPAESRPPAPPLPEDPSRERRTFADVVVSVVAACLIVPAYIAASFDGDVPSGPIFRNELPLARPFLLGMPADRLRSEFNVELVKEHDGGIWLGLTPRTRERRSLMTHAVLILEADTFRPRALKIVDDCMTTVHVFDEVRFNAADGPDLASPPLARAIWRTPRRQRAASQENAEPRIRGTAN